MTMSNNNKYMQLALDMALTSGKDIPVGCVIVKDSKVIAKAVNTREKTNDISAHAEIMALREASRVLGNWRLSGCKLYVTLEPCPMCAWAILNSRADEIYFGSYDTKYGAFGSKINLVNISDFKPKVFGGIMEDECNRVLEKYFLELRK